MFILKTCCNKEKPVVRTGLWFRAHFCPLLPWLRTSLVLILCLLDICYADSCICSSCTDWAELPLWLPNLQELCRQVPCHGGYRLAMCSFLLFGDWLPRFHIQIPYIAPFFAWGRTIDISFEWTLENLEDLDEHFESSYIDPDENGDLLCIFTLYKTHFALY